MDMARYKVIPGLALDRDILCALELWRRSQDVPPAKTAVQEAAIREFLERRHVPIVEVDDDTAIELLGARAEPKKKGQR